MDETKLPDKNTSETKAPSTDGTRTAIWVAAIAALSAVVVAYIGYLAKPSDLAKTSYAYTVIVRDPAGHPIPNAKVSVAEDQSPPEFINPDSNGVSYIQLSTKTDSIRIIVTAEGYADQEFETKPTRTGPHEIVLAPVPPPPPSPSGLASIPAQSATAPDPSIRLRKFFRIYMWGAPEGTFTKIIDGCCQMAYTWTFVELNDCVLSFKQEVNGFHFDHNPDTHEVYDFSISLAKLPARTVRVEHSAFIDNFEQIDIEDPTEKAITITQSAPVQRILRNYDGAIFTMNAGEQDKAIFVSDFESLRQSCASK